MKHNNFDDEPDGINMLNKNRDINPVNEPHSFGLVSVYASHMTS